jgi:hypothetical protein
MDRRDGYLGMAEDRGQVGPEIGPTSSFYRYIPTGIHGPTYILWANLTPFLMEVLGGAALQDYNTDLAAIGQSHCHHACALGA